MVLPNSQGHRINSICSSSEDDGPISTLLSRSGARSKEENLNICIPPARPIQFVASSYLYFCTRNGGDEEEDKDCLDGKRSINTHLLCIISSSIPSCHPSNNSIHLETILTLHRSKVPPVNTGDLHRDSRCIEPR